jgi:isopenicillin N synthase-like dioxygenase
MSTTVVHSYRRLSIVPEDVHTISPRAPPVIDFSSFYTDDTAKKAVLVQQVRQACLEKGFFQITNHGISEDLQSAIFEQAADFFSLPLEEKMKYDKTVHPNKLGYEPMRSQNFEGKTAGDLKEGYFIGRRLPLDHQYVREQRIHCGKNAYPSNVRNPTRFERTVDRYHAEMTKLAEKILSVIAMTLGMEEDYFRDFCHEPAAVLRLLHYPPQEPDASADERGIGAHTDFGGVTLLLQDDVGGLQVFDAPSKSWIDVKPTPGAFVVNLGNVMMRWSNDKYKSNLHRVINKSGKERYSIPFFYSGNPDFMIGCLPGCEDGSQGSKYPPVRVEDWIFGRHTNTFREAKGLQELSELAKIAAS